MCLFSLVICAACHQATYTHAAGGHDYWSLMNCPCLPDVPYNKMTIRAAQGWTLHGASQVMFCHMTFQCQEYSLTFCRLSCQVNCLHRHSDEFNKHQPVIRTALTPADISFPGAAASFEHINMHPWYDVKVHTVAMMLMILRAWQLRLSALL